MHTVALGQKSLLDRIVRNLNDLSWELMLHRDGDTNNSRKSLEEIRKDTIGLHTVVCSEERADWLVGFNRFLASYGYGPKTIEGLLDTIMQEPTDENGAARLESFCARQAIRLMNVEGDIKAEISRLTTPLYRLLQ